MPIKYCLEFLLRWHPQWPLWIRFFDNIYKLWEICHFAFSATRCYPPKISEHGRITLHTFWWRHAWTYWLISSARLAYVEGRVAGHFVTRSFRHNLRSFRHSQFVTPELPNQRRFGCPALYYYHDYTMGQSSKQLQRLFACFKDWTVIVCLDN